MSNKMNVMPIEDRKHMQKILLEMMIEFDRVCRENNIKYIIEGGTLLGAVRHHGFIPWDEDIDVRMLRSDYDKFSQIASEKLPADMFFQSYSNDKGYPWLYGKIRKKGTRAVRAGQEKLKMKDGIFIDVFPCDGVPDEKNAKRRHNITAKICRKILYARTARYTDKNVIKRILWNILCVIPRKYVYRTVERMSKKYTQYNCSKVGIIGWHGIEDVNGFSKMYFEQLTELEFEGYMFYAPQNWDGFLRYAFGDDYMELPPKEQRVSNLNLSYYDFGE